MEASHKELAESAPSKLWLAHDLVARQARLRPDRIALVEMQAGRQTSYAELDRRIARGAVYLERKLSGPGARIAFLARNTLHHVTFFYASARAGMIYVPLNWRLPSAELKPLIEDAEPELLVYQAEFEAAARTAVGGRTCKLICIAREADELEAALGGVEPSTSTVRDPDAPSTLLYTSGTTGRSKGVIITPRSAFFSALNFSTMHELTNDSVVLCETPLFHVVALLAAQHATMFTGAKLLLDDRFLPARTLERCANPALDVTHYFCVPQMAQVLRKEPDYTPKKLAGLKAFITGGAPMPLTLAESLLADGVMWANGYGTSEAGTVFGMPHNREIAGRKLGSSGIAAPCIAARLVGLDGRDVEQGEVGEIWLGGPAVTRGYWNQPNVTAAAFENGWLRTGDAARQDEDGYYYIVDRWKDMYITGGENVYPAEVEGALREIAGVRDAAVIGVPDARWGETGCAYVVIEPGSDVSDERVAEHCAQRLAGYKRPTIIRFVDEIPRTATGKTLKDALRQRYAAERQETAPTA